MGLAHPNPSVLFNTAPPSPTMLHVKPFHVVPLSYHAIHKEAVVSPSPLLKLPVELVPNIMCYLAKDDLCSVSLVDTVCRRLAALELFKTLRVDLSCGNKAMKCLDALKLLDGTSPSRISIASCVRHLIVQSRLPLPQSPEEVIYRGYKTGPCYIKATCHLIEKFLPNVHIIDWNITGAMPPHVFQSIISSSAKHVRILKTVFTQPFSLAASSSQFESLHLDLAWFPPEIDPTAERVVTVYDEILSKSSRTLRQLIWQGGRTNAHIDLQSCKSFPQLRKLTLDQVSQHMDHVLPIFLNKDTRVSVLALDTISGAARQFYRSKGYLSTLDELCWINHENDSGHEDVFIFLQANDQLNTFQVTSALSPDIIETRFLPLFQSDFKGLTSLKLIWGAEKIPESSLKALQELVSLRHLWLSAGNQNIYRSTWIVDHDDMMEHLKPLQYLRTLGFSYDTYSTYMHPLAPRYGDYYSNKLFPKNLEIKDYLDDEEFKVYLGTSALDFDQGVEMQVEMRCLAWERMHRAKMAGIASKYAAVFKHLEWVFMGQLSMRRDEDAGVVDGEPVMRIVEEERDRALTLLNEKLSVMAWTPMQ